MDEVGDHLLQLVSFMFDLFELGLVLCERFGEGCAIFLLFLQFELQVDGCDVMAMCLFFQFSTELLLNFLDLLLQLL